MGHIFAGHLALHKGEPRLSYFFLWRKPFFRQGGPWPNAPFLNTPPLMIKRHCPCTYVRNCWCKLKNTVHADYHVGQDAARVNLPDLNLTLPDLISTVGRTLQCSCRMSCRKDQWRSQPRKSGGPNKMLLLVSSKKLQYTCMGPPPLYIKHFSTDLCKSQEGSEQKWGGPDPPPPWRRHWEGHCSCRLPPRERHCMFRDNNYYNL